MPEQDFLPFGIGAGANVIDQATYAAAQSTGFVAVGFAAGLAQSAQVNKVWRQATVMAYVMGQFISDLLVSQDVLDNADTATLLAQFKSAVLAQSGGSSTPLIITASVDLALNATQTEVALNRTVSPVAFNLTLPDIAVGRSCTVTDIVGNLSTAKVKIFPPAGTISTKANFTMNEDLQSCTFTRYSNLLWGVKT